MAKENKHVQEEVLKDLESLEIGESVIVPVKGGWELEITKTENGLEFKHYNPWKGDRSKEAFYTYSNRNPNGSGMMDQEKTVGIPCRKCGIDSDGRIIGVLVTDNSEEIVDRFSLSKIIYVQERNLNITENGEVKIDEESKGFVHLLFLPDKNRLDGFVCITTPNKQEVKIMEMEDLLMRQI